MVRELGRKKESELQLLQAQKMEAVGRLAGGLAHDINNYVNAITSQCELVLMKAQPGDRVAAKMEMVIATAGKITEFKTRQSGSGPHTLIQAPDGTIWFTEQSLSNALRLETYISDAEQDGDTELAEFFRRAQDASRRGGEEGKKMLASRLATANR